MSIAERGRGVRGVLNIVHGTHDTVNRMLEHPDIKALAFVGSDAAGRYVYEKGCKHGKRVQVGFPGASEYGIANVAAASLSCLGVGNSFFRSGQVSHPEVPWCSAIRGTLVFSHPEVPWCSVMRRYLVFGHPEVPWCPCMYERLAGRTAGGFHHALSR